MALCWIFQGTAGQEQNVDPYNVSVFKNRTLSSFVEIMQLIVIKILKTFTDEIQSVISNRNCLMSMTKSKLESFLIPKSFCFSVEAIISSVFIIVWERFMSSANKNASLPTMWGISLTNIVKSRGLTQNSVVHY